MKEHKKEKVSVRKNISVILMMLIILLSAGAQTITWSPDVSFSPEDRQQITSSLTIGTDILITDVMHTKTGTWIAGLISELNIVGDMTETKIVYLLNDEGAKRRFSKPKSNDEFRLATAGKNSIYIFSINHEDIYSQPVVFRLFEDSGSLEQLNLPRFVGFPSGFTCFNGSATSDGSRIKFPAIILGAQKYISVDFDSGRFTVTDN